MLRRRLLVAAGWTAALLLMLSGCFFQSPEDLYRSPERSADYLSLTQTIRNVKNSLSQTYGVEVEDISVMSGDNTALIQLQDLDGDGSTETAVTFFRVPEADRPLKIYFFTKSEDDTYTASAVVEGSGSSIYRVDYVDLNGNGYKEVVVSWQMNTGAYLLGAYSLEEVMAQNVQQAMVYSSEAASFTVTQMPQPDTLRAEEWLTTAYTYYQRGGDLWLAGRRFPGPGVSPPVCRHYQQRDPKCGHEFPSGGGGCPGSRPVYLQ